MVRLWVLKVRSQLRAVMSTSLILQTMETAATLILLNRGSMGALPSNRRDIARRSNGPSSDPREATTAASASADGPLAVADAADADEKPTTCPMAQKSITVASRFVADVRANFIYVSSICSALARSPSSLCQVRWA